VTRFEVGPLAVWRAARLLCEPSCFAYHASWPLVRGIGVKASPRWHAGFYRRELDRVGLLRDHRPLRVLVAGTADHTMLAVLAELVAPHRLDVHVVDQCGTSLWAVGQWAALAGPGSLRTVQARLQDYAPGSRYDVVVTDGVLSLLPDTAARHRVLARLGGALADGGLLLYTTRLTTSRALEYDLAGRVVQTAAALTWIRAQPSARRLAVERWRRPSRSAAYGNTAQLRDDLHLFFGDVAVHVDATAPTAALRVHPRRWRGHGSTVVRIAASHPKAACYVH
jgi:hypothetical protein